MITWVKRLSSKMSWPLGFLPSTSGSLLPSLATDSDDTYSQYPMSCFLESFWPHAAEEPNAIAPQTSAIGIALFMVPSLFGTARFFASCAAGGADGPAPCGK